MEKPRIGTQQGLGQSPGSCDSLWIARVETVICLGRGSEQISKGNVKLFYLDGRKGALGVPMHSSSNLLAQIESRLTQNTEQLKCMCVLRHF